MDLESLSGNFSEHFVTPQVEQIQPKSLCVWLIPTVFILSLSVLLCTVARQAICILFFLLVLVVSQLLQESVNYYGKAGIRSFPDYIISPDYPFAFTIQPTRLSSPKHEAQIVDLRFVRSKFIALELPHCLIRVFWKSCSLVVRPCAHT